MRTHYIKAVLSSSLLTALCACHKSNSAKVSPASVTVINAVQGSPGIIPVFGTTEPLSDFMEAQAVGYAQYQVYSPLSGRDTLYAVQSDDTLPINAKTELFNAVVNLSAGGIYSLFFSGDTTATDTLLIQDNLPLNADSVSGVRIVNLVPGSTPINITMQGNSPAQTEFSGLAYKSVSDWRTYSASTAAPGYYIFTVRDMASGDSLSNFTWYYTLFRNSTLVVCGSETPGTNYPIQVFEVHDF